MQIRFFNTYEPVTTFYRDLLPYLAEKGITSEVLISSAEYRLGGREDLAKSFAGSTIQIQKISSLGLEPNNRISKALIMLFYSIGSTLRAIFGKGVQVNFFLTQPPLFNLLGWILKKVRRQLYICLVMDIYPDVAIQDGLLAKNSCFTKLLSKLSHFALQQADAVIVIGRCMAERLIQTKVPKEKIHLIPNWANPEIIFPVPASKNKLRQELGLSDKFIVLYSGNMGVSHYFKDILKVIKSCRNEPGLHFVFIGGGQRSEEIRAFMLSDSLNNMTLLPFQPLSRLAESLSLGDVHFISLRKGFEGIVVPSKMYGVMAAGRAVIYQGSSTGEIARMITENEIGVVIEPGNVNYLKDIIQSYQRNPNLAEKQGLKAYKLSQEKYSIATALEKYYQVISKVIYV